MTEIKTCRICGQERSGRPFNDWVADTFTNYDLLYPGEVICDECYFWFDQHSVELQRRMGKDKPQKMQNYSHFIVGGEWEPVSKGNKARMAELLLSPTFPEMAAIAVSGQKHLAFRAPRNPPGQNAGWVQFEEQPVWVNQEELSDLLRIIEELYTVYSKNEIESGHYSPGRTDKFGLGRLLELEEIIRPQRKTALFQLALFLAQKGLKDGDESSGDGRDVRYPMARDRCYVQIALSDDNLGTI